jgi:hypothetical protein
MYSKTIPTKPLLPGLALAFALAFLLMVSPVYAQDAQPPQEPVSVLPVGDSPAQEPLEEQATEDSEPLPELQSAESPADDPSSNSSNTTESPSFELVLEVVAENDLVLADSNGDVLDLASKHTSEVLSGADPYWKVGSTLYAVVKNAIFCPAETTFGLTCWVDANPIFFALGQISTPGFFPTDGFLYVEGDTYNESITITGGALATLKGIIGVDGSSATILNGNVNISNTIAGFTLQGFTINGRLLMNNNTGTLNLTDLDINYTAAALSPISVANHNGAINVKQVKSSGNRGSNSFNNAIGTGNITITNSAFDHNNPASAGLYAQGIYINTNGSVTIDGVSASNNNGNGLFILQGANLVIKNSVFNNNYGTPDNSGAGFGITAAMDGNITINQTIANGNERSGFNLTSAKAITLSDITANGNSMFGALINAVPGSGAVKVSYSEFNGNANTGLDIDAKGAVTLTSIKALNNTLHGVFVDNCLWNGTICAGTGSVTITSLKAKGDLFANQFNNNGSSGIEVISRNNILLENFTANNNTGSSGVVLNNANGSGNVTIKTTLTDWLNQANANNASGIAITSKGSVMIDKVLSRLNGGHGMNVQNHNAGTLKAVTVSNSVIDNNGSNGIFINSRGLITLINVDIRDHASPGAFGAYLVNNTNNGSGGVTVKASSGKSNYFNNNNIDGLNIQTNGIVSIADAQFVNNGNIGLKITSEPASGMPSVSLLRVTADNNSNGEGVQIFARGPVLLSAVTSINHGNATGAYITNQGSSGTPGITVRDSIFNNNANGLYVYSKGAILISTIEASYNQNSGLYVDNTAWDGLAYTGVGSITLTSVKGKENIFLWNSNTGVILYSKNNISITNMRSEYNGDEGISISNNFPDAKGSVTIKALAGQSNNLNFNGQDGSGHGIIVYSYGAINAGNLIAEYNNNYGGYFDNSGAASPKSILISDSVFSNNQNNGISAYSLGLITLKGVTASDNTKYNWPITNIQTANDFLSSNHKQDVWSFNGTSGGTANIILQSSFFDAFLELRDENWGLIASDDNSFGGTDALINILNLPYTGEYFIVATSASLGESGKYRLSLNDPAQSTNIYYYIQGAILSNASGEAGIAILPSSAGFGGRFEQNNDYGVALSTRGTITLNRVFSNFNGSSGVTADNSSGTNKSVALTSSSFNQNGNVGLNLYTSGNFSWNGGGASENDYYGLYMNGVASTTTNTATLTNVNFNDNGSTGLQILVYGNIFLNSVNASGNDFIGGYIDNCLWNGSSCPGSGSITINSAIANQFNANTYRGITLSTRGSIKITNISANGNGDMGINISAFNGTGAVVVQNPSARFANTINNNGGYGIFIESAGAITINKVNLDANTLSNLRLSNISAAAPVGITLTSVKTTNSVNENGMFVLSAGAITIRSTTALDNFYRGAYLESYGDQHVQVNTSVFNRNGYIGLEVNAIGNVTLNGIAANENDDVGIRINNTAGSGKVELLGTLGENFINGNALVGLHITTNGDITLSKVTAVDNTLMGINAISSGTAGFVRVDTLKTISNGQTGISIQTNGKVTINKLISFYNGTLNNTDGLYVNTTSMDGVIISNSYFIGNEGSGVEANVIDPVTMVTIINTTYLGNDSDNSGDPDLNIY